MEKKGQGLSTSTIILLVLGLIILVVLVLGFTIGWNKLKGILGGDSGDNNVDQVAQACELACSTGSTYDFCSRTREIKIGGEDPIQGTCGEFSNSASAKYKAEYSIAACADISCP